ncbi:MAG: hypothetical protein GY792_33260 [Gammaproteobacteria bacterium]|nr:hypothetical protein [Gammaproteobacteria bacterium]
MNKVRHFLPLLYAGLLSCSLALANEPCPDPEPQTYPTSARVDYVIGCMAANGQTPEMMQKCSCSIDFIASAISYSDYEKIETLLRLQQMPGVGRNAIYSNSSWSKKAVLALREVQAESTLRCF